MLTITEYCKFIELLETKNYFLEFCLNLNFLVGLGNDAMHHKLELVNEYEIKIQTLKYLKS